MIRKGIHFRIARKIVTLPTTDENGQRMPYVEPGKEHYCYFGRAIMPGKPIPPNAVKTGWKWYDNTGENVWAVPFKDQRHSLTNMVYEGERAIIMVDGQVYSGRNPYWDKK